MAVYSMKTFTDFKVWFSSISTALILVYVLDHSILTFFCKYFKNTVKLDIGYL